MTDLPFGPPVHYCDDCSCSPCCCEPEDWSDCGLMLVDGTCTKAGSEECDFDCPHRPRQAKAPR